MFQNLSPVLRALLSSPHPRPHEGLSRVVLKVRAGSGACGAGSPDLRPGRLSQTSMRFEKSAPASGPSVGHYDPSGVSCPWGREPHGASVLRSATEWRSREEALRPVRLLVEARDAKDRNRRTRTPGERFFRFRNGRSAPVSSLFAFRARGSRATAMTHAL